MDVALLVVAAAAAGWVDAVVGGGGLVLIPAMLIAQPGLPIATALGTNKLAAVFGTASAAWRYVRHVRIDLRRLIPVFVAALVFSALGATVAVVLPTEIFTPIVLVMLVGVGLFVALNPGFGTDASTGPRSRVSTIAGLVLAGVVVAFYDGVMGPGTGTFLIISLTALVGTSFLESSAMAKVINTGTNLGALTVFGLQGNVLWLLGLGLAIANVVGAQIGSHMAIGRGSSFVRWVLLAVVVVMVGKLGYDLIVG